MRERILVKNITFLFLLLFLNGCASYHCPACHFNNPLPKCKKMQKTLKEASCSPIYTWIPRHRNQIKWYDLPHWTTWALAGNDDDGIFGESQNNPYKQHMSNDPGKALCWWVRNPFHNLFHYVLGSAHRINSEFTLLNLHCRGIQMLYYTPIAKKNFGAQGSSLFLALHGGKPYISLRLVYFNKHQTDFYLGWRKNGAFGFKLHFFKARERGL